MGFLKGPGGRAWPQVSAWPCSTAQTKPWVGARHRGTVQDGKWLWPQCTPPSQAVAIITYLTPDLFFYILRQQDGQVRNLHLNRFPQIMALAASAR